MPSTPGVDNNVVFLYYFSFNIHGPVHQVMETESDINEYPILVTISPTTSAATGSSNLNLINYQ
jgi:hypothetical protein